MRDVRAEIRKYADGSGPYRMAGHDTFWHRAAEELERRTYPAERDRVERVVEAAKVARRALAHLMPNGDEVEDELLAEAQAIWNAEARLRIALAELEEATCTASTTAG